MARMMHRATLSAMLALLAAGALQPALANSIAVTSPQQGRTDPRNCSLQEAIQSANLHQAIAIDSTNPDHFYSTGCSPGSGIDIIVLPEGILLQMSAVAGDAHNPMGPTATPIVFSNIVIEANGATLMPTAGAPAMRAFAVGAASINTPNGVISGTGKLTIRNAYIKGFHVNGGDGASGGGGGMGAGGAIYIDGSIGIGIAELTIENSTFDGNGAVGGNGSHYSNSGPGGGGGGLNGAGGIAESEQSGVDLASGGGGGGGGSRGNGGANGGKTRTCVPVQPGCNGQWTSPAGGGGGGTVSDGSPAFSFGPGVDRAGGFRCGGDGGDYAQDGHDAASSCPGGGGGGGGKPDQALVRLGGDGGDGSYGGGGGGGGFHQSDTSGFTFGRQGGRGGFGGGGGAGGQDDNGGDGGFGGGGGAGGDTPGAKGAYGGPGLHQGGGAGAGLGGAIFSHIANVVVRNSTFINNYVSHGLPEGGGWGGDAGGAIFAVDGTLAVHNTTVSGNQSTGTGAGIVVDRTLTDLVTSFTLRNTIIANNGAQECMYFNGVSATGSGNLIMRNAGCPGVVVALDPQLGPLQPNAPGSTPTMAIDLSSPAYNAADAPTSLAEDQRGVSRPQATGFDIGAYEFVKPLADLAIATTTLGEPHPGERFSYLIEVENQGPTDAQNVTITDVLPNGTVFSSITGSGNFNCTGTGPVVCTKQTMTRGEIDALTLTVSIPLSIVKGTPTKNSASITSTTPDPNLSNNAASVSAVLQ